MTDPILHIQVNFGLFLLAAGISAANIVLMLNLSPSRPYRPMRRAQLGMCFLEMLTAAVIAIAIGYRLSAVSLSIDMQFWLQTLMGANMIGAGAVTLSRVLYERMTRQPQAQATQRLIDDYLSKMRAENDPN